jgi:ubiquinone/menaquinone biosynthesis C-methylase UbiE
MLSLQQTFWKLWYQYISDRIASDTVTFLNYGYWPAEGETLLLEPEDEPNRPAIQLYHHVAGGADLAGKHVLEVSCGHGGGASFIKRYHKPKSYTAIDQNPKAISANRKAHASLGIDFQIGDAQALNFPENHFDAVLNVEASHCYPKQKSFFQSAQCVLKPGGSLLYADFRPVDADAQLDQDIRDAGFQIRSKTDITPHVISALKQTSQRYRRLARKLAPQIFHGIMESFAAVEGSGMFNRFVDGAQVYWSYQLTKPN